MFARPQISLEGYATKQWTKAQGYSTYGFIRTCNDLLYLSKTWQTIPNTLIGLGVGKYFVTGIFQFVIAPDDFGYGALQVDDNVLGNWAITYAQQRALCTQVWYLNLTESTTIRLVAKVHYLVGKPFIMQYHSQMAVLRLSD